MTRRPWTDRDSDILRQLYAEGRSDVDMAYIMGRFRTVIARYRRRLALGPPKGKPGSHKGRRLSPEAKAKIGAATARRWAAGLYQPDRMNTTAARAERNRRRFRRPPPGTAERRLYEKIAEAIGASAARAAWLEGRL